MANGKLVEILYLIDKNINDGILLHSEEIQAMINENKDSFTGNDYYKIVSAVMEKLHLDDSENIKEIFMTKPKFNIETYKKILRIEATLEFDKFKSDKESIFVSLSRNICSDLEYLSASEVMRKYSKEIELIQEVNESSELIHLIREHKESIDSCDNLKIIDTKTRLKEFTRKFNAKYKEYYIKKYIDKEIDKIKDDFELKNDYNAKAVDYISEEAFLKLFLDQNITSNNFKIKIYNYFNIEVTNQTIKQIIHNILNDKDVSNYALFGILESVKNLEVDLPKLNESIAFTRLNQNYLRQIQDTFKDFDQTFLLNIFNNLYNLSNYKESLTKREYYLLTEVKSIFIEANCNVSIKENQICFTKEDNLTDLEKKAVKADLKNYKKYLGIKNKILDYYVGASKARRTIAKLPDKMSNHYILFDDDNYKLKNVGDILDIEILFGILKHIDCEKVDNYNEELISYIKKVVFNEGLLASVMKYHSNIDIANIINGVGTIKDFEKIKNIKKLDLEYLLKQTKLYNIADDFTVSILGFNTANKLINNRQFLQHNSREDIKRRLDKAVDLMVRSIDKNTSSIPYNIHIEEGSISIERYKNNDPEILISGIDTNTCFRLDGNDNDFVFYSILNKNAAVLKIFDQEQFIGRASIFRQANVLFINGIRTVDEKDENISKEKIERNKNIFRCLEKFGKQMINDTENTDLPIDFVVCNKAGILESSYFKNAYYMVPEYLVEQPLDIYNEDWEEFIHTYDNCKENYFMQVKEGERVPFTTDFGHYPALLIASRNDRLLQRKFDISYSSPGDIYYRPKDEVSLYKGNDESILEKIYRIDAFKCFYEVGSIEKAKEVFRKRKIDTIKKAYIGEDSYYIIYKDGKEENVSFGKRNRNENKRFSKRK